MKKRAIGVLVACMGLLLVGCSQTRASIDKDTIMVNRKGCITEVLVDVFDKDYYDMSEVEMMAVNEIADFNASQERQAVTFDSVVQEKDHLVKMTLRYVDPLSYCKFNGVTFFYGTVEEAYKAGYDLNVKLRSANESKEVGLDEILGMGDRFILISSKPSYIKLPNDILYVSSNVTQVNNKSEAMVEDDGKPIYIISK